MSKPVIYVSVPMQVHWDMYVYPHIERLQKLGFEVDYWKRGMPYSSEPLRKADAVLVVLQDNKFKIHIGDLTLGVRTELEQAKFMEKPIMIGYKTQSHGEYHIYDAEEQPDREFGGVAGYYSNEDLTNCFKNMEHAKKSLKSSPMVTTGKAAITVEGVNYYDRRLLLLC